MCWLAKARDLDGEVVAFGEAGGKPRGGAVADEGRFVAPGHPQQVCPHRMKPVMPGQRIVELIEPGKTCS